MGRCCHNVLTYDIRNHGSSGAANRGLSGIGNREWRDYVGAKNFVDADPKLSKMTVSLYSHCMGGNLQCHAGGDPEPAREGRASLHLPMTASNIAAHCRRNDLVGDLKIPHTGLLLSGELLEEIGHSSKISYLRADQPKALGDRLERRAPEYRA